MPRYNDDDRDRPSWSEIDKMRDKSSHSKGPRPLSLKGQEKSRLGRAALGRAFKDGTLASVMKSKGLEDDLGEDKPERFKLVNMIRDAASPDEAHKAVNGLLKKFDLPDDLEVLALVIDHPDSTVARRALKRISVLLEKERPKRKQALKNRLDMVALLYDDPELEELAEEVSRKIV